MMYSLWLLLAALPEVLLFTVWRTRLFDERALANIMLSVPRPNSQPTIVSASSASPTWAMKWHSTNERVKVLARCNDLIAIDPRPDAQTVPLPASNSSVPSVATKELDSVLEPIPAGRFEVFCCVSSPNLFMIENSPWRKNPAPQSLLAGDLALGEVA